MRVLELYEIPGAVARLQEPERWRDCKNRSDGATARTGAVARLQEKVHLMVYWITGQRITGLASLALLVPALYWTVRLEHADWLFIKGGAPSIEEAIRLAPGTADYYSSLAQADPVRAVSILKEGAALNPLDASLRLELGLAAEQEGDFPAAEANLLEATRLDTGFGPRWALSDFYFYRHEAEKFWPVTKAALAISYGDITAQFRHCWAFTADPTPSSSGLFPTVPQFYGSIWIFYDRGPDRWPDRGKDRWTARGMDRCRRAGRRQATRERRSSGGAVAAELLRPHAGQMARRGSPPRLERAGERKLVGYPDLRQPGSGHGFDGEISPAEGIHANRSADGLILRFSGNNLKTSKFEPLYAVAAHRQYVLAVRIAFPASLRNRV